MLCVKRNVHLNHTRVSNTTYYLIAPPTPPSSLSYCSIPLTDTTQVTVSGTKVVLHLSVACGPWPNTAYNASIPAGALANDAGVATSDKLMVSDTRVDILDAFWVAMVVGVGRR